MHEAKDLQISLFDISERIEKLNMNRKSFDRIASVIGLMLAVFLFVAGGLLQWGASFAGNAVSTQLEAQKITLPTTTQNSEESKDVTEFFATHGGKLMSTGKEAQMYADHYLGFHLSKMPTYADASNASRSAAAAAAAAPGDAAKAKAASSAQSMVDTVFKGVTLRGTLLTAYAFWQLGQVAMYGAIAAFAGGLLFLVLALLGFAHLRRVAADEAI